MTEGDQTYELLDADGERTVLIVGRELASASSDDGKRLDWTTIRIFLTESGMYVAAVAGLTRRRSGFEKHRVHLAATASGVIEALHQYDGDSVRYLTRLARTAIEEAASQDPAIDDAYRIERVA